VLVYLCFYSFCKRFTKWSHFVLGTAIAMSPVASWVAIHPASLGVSALLLAAAVTCWIGGFDIIYSCQDIEVDRADRLYSLPSRIGPGPALWIARGAHAVSVMALAALGVTAELGVLYGLGVGIAATLLLVENVLVRAGDYRHVNMAFFTINGVVSVVLAASAIADVLL
jgi:4-hydroxybenzoate polyprenyltransferase